MRKLIRAAALTISLATFGAAVAGCQPQGAGKAVPFDGSTAEDGAQLIRQVGCGGCHSIPGIGDADGLVGPPLDHMSRRIFIAGVLRNTPDNMVTWLQHPQAIVPGNAMPDMDLTEDQAQAITNYLYTLD